MELACAWFIGATPQCPPEMQYLLATEPVLAEIVFREGYPEFVTSLPVRGEGRNHDLLLRGSADGREVLICVEAKADEEFGEIVGDYWTQMKNSSKRTRVPERIEKLLRTVFGPNARPDVGPWCDLSYQLLTGVSGTVIQAEKDEIATAVFIVHEFQTPSVQVKKLTVNAAAYARLVACLFSIPAEDVMSGVMYPTRATGEAIELRGVRLFVGKAVYEGSRSGG